METLRQDLQYALRMLSRGRTTTLFAIVALALGIGANSAIFSVFNAVLLRPLPYEDPGRLVLVYGVLMRDGEMERRSSSYPDFVDWRDRNRVFESITAVDGPSFSLTGVEVPERLQGEIVSAGYFATLGVQPALGRTFSPEEDRTPDAHPVVVISHRLWQRRFGSDQQIIGKTMQLNGTAYQVIGVMPETFRGVADPRGEIWLPMAMVSSVRPARILTQRQQRWMSAVARLKPGVTMSQAQAEMLSISRELEELYPESNTQRAAEVASLHEEWFGQYRLSLSVLLAAVGFVLLIACGNVANLLLARSSAREKEIAIRRALGAGRIRVVRQLLTESVVLALAGGALGLLFALWATDLLLSQNLILFPAFVAVGLDGRVLGFTLAVSMLTGVFFGIFPAIQAARPNLGPSLKEGGRGFPGGVRRTRMLGALVVSEVTLSVVLLIGAVLMIRSVRELQTINPGFDAGNVLTMQLSLPARSYNRTQILNFTRQTMERVAALPGVEYAGFGSDLPLSGQTSAGPILIEGRPTPPAGQENVFYRHRISPDYFKALGIRLLHGRSFTWDDNENSLRVVIVSDAFARRFWPGTDAIGKRVREDGAPAGWLTVVGIAGDVKFRGLPENPDSHPDVYFPLAQFPDLDLMIAVRTRVEPQSMTSSLQRVINEIDPNLPGFNPATMHELAGNQTANSSFTTILLAIFSGLALFLAMIGVYGVMSYSVDQRRHEIGVRMALGAQGSDIFRLLAGRGMGLVMAGLVLGIGLALVLTRLMSRLLYNVTASDPVTFAAISLLMIAVSLLVSYLPARRASRVDPMAAVRYE